jgi:regulation of enolase protein 1 (concanavalin A-like superfamily)
MRTIIAAIGAAFLLCAAAGATDRVVFEDKFEGKLGEGWRWLRENPKNWRIKDGGLEIRIEPGKANDVKNALVRPAPDRSEGKYSIEVTVTFLTPPTNQYEQAGITWYHDDKPAFKLVHELVDGKTMTIPGRLKTTTNTVRLRMVVERDRFITQVALDGKGEYQNLAGGPFVVQTKDEISLQCYNGPADAEHWVRFENFRIERLE